ncbi:NAD-dependent epimerase/dehydratase family protein [Pararhodospirillum oryzae]|uniref:NAD-dependent epimerase n=1 Tax=Pararhodospirillum oryzae TaxID=478448 RepID=A0A512H9V7_9PROT|nr:NAD(P)-dependent oxidoreductase [Pararhodospirillum oryzae]GEO82170.1 NAD-dependent epimerase [Pararhodospirillum oryzae]
MKRSDTVIVFGGSGFLGSHVADALSDTGFDVRIFDLVPSPYLRSDQTMIVGSILDAALVREATAGCKVVYNFAALADIDDAADKPATTLTTNVVGMINTLEAAREFCARRFVFASSVYVFSVQGGLYRASKQAAELFIEAYQARFGLPFTILRYGSLYGRRANQNNTIHRMVREALTTGTITYYGSDQAQREYIHVSDAARMSVKILSPEFENRHVVLTGQEHMLIRDVMQMIATISGREVGLSVLPTASDSHYVHTPYSFRPQVGHKLVSNDFVDMGQGLLDCMAEIHETLPPADTELPEPI